MPLFADGYFHGSSGQTLPWKLECDALTKEDWSCLAQRVALQYQFRQVFGVPRGGLFFESALRPYCTPGSSLVLVVDDVLTTGRSMTRLRDSLILEKGVETVVGIVVFSRELCVPDWITPIFQLSPIFDK